MQIKYTERRMWKYKLEEDVVFETGIVPCFAFSSEFLNMWSTELTIYAGYCWDGASGPTVDTKNSLPPSLVHDALYQLIREGALPKSARKRADEIFREICIECGMNKVRAWLWYRGLRAGGAKATESRIKVAP